VDPGFLDTISKHTHVPLTGTKLEIYPSLLGSLKYAGVCTRPDNSTALSILGSTHVNPTMAHMQALKKVLRYLKGAPNLRLRLGGDADNSLQLIGFDDADMSNDKETRRSRSSFVSTLGRGTVSYKSNK
jgi:hypothetical protein